MVPFLDRKKTVMKQQTVDYIKSLCAQDLRQKNNMDKAQVMLKNMNVFREYGCKAGYSGNIPFEQLEHALKLMVRKYDVLVGQILAITDVEGEVTWHGGMYYVDRDKKVDRLSESGRNVWLFTIHSTDLYEYMVKLVLMSFVSIKTSGKVKRRDPETVKSMMRRY